MIDCRVGDRDPAIRPFPGAHVITIRLEKILLRSEQPLVNIFIGVVETQRCLPPFNKIIDVARYGINALRERSAPFLLQRSGLEVVQLCWSGAPNLSKLGPPDRWRPRFCPTGLNVGVDEAARFTSTGNVGAANEFTWDAQIQRGRLEMEYPLCQGLWF